MAQKKDWKCRVIGKGCASSNFDEVETKPLNLGPFSQARQACQLKKKKKNSVLTLNRTLNQSPLPICCFIPKHLATMRTMITKICVGIFLFVCLSCFFMCKIPLKGSRANCRLPTFLLISAWCAQSAESCWHSIVQVRKTRQTGGSHSRRDGLEEQESSHLQGSDVIYAFLFSPCPLVVWACWHFTGRFVLLFNNVQNHTVQVLNKAHKWFKRWKQCSLR